MGMLELIAGGAVLLFFFSVWSVKYHFHKGRLFVAFLFILLALLSFTFAVTAFFLGNVTLNVH